MKVRAEVDLTPHKEALRSAVDNIAARQAFEIVPATRVYEYAVKVVRAEMGTQPDGDAVLARSAEAMARLAAIEADRKQKHAAVDACRSLPEIQALRSDWGL